jgi:hypothetical protein
VVNSFTGWQTSAITYADFGNEVLVHALDADQRIKDCADVLGVDRCLEGGAHLVNLRLPLWLRQRRLVEHMPAEWQTTQFTNGRFSATDLHPLERLGTPADIPVAIREVIGRHGTKFGCGPAQCGACTVHIGGQATQPPTVERRQS